MSDEKSSVCPVCKQPAILKCSLCKDIAYCCKDHQKKDWKSHKNLCRPFEVNCLVILIFNLSISWRLSYGNLDFLKSIDSSRKNFWNCQYPHQFLLERIRFKKIYPLFLYCKNALEVKYNSIST